ncbi:glycoside hydrolase family 3 protein [Lachnoclostridium phytofermentans]|uniref:Glycoside hydrolase family 3 domain protein n=1 Tax=Lachnoclostridium phytofermentans (strain ATCC 700394 / DSM 18823 / ISDg) TaxID=357809 RepID=A9KMQ8_LACP7|nr:glycoside hydrolase family 3 protein [Lachnoclostridium phytofermentans]ABX41503.1 glycoside hydrolase family 3 domain protein [Lachnoclostridium phytofermentans ISDg]
MDLSIRGKVGQRIVAGFPGTTIDSELEDFIRTYKIGNFILFKENIVDANQLSNLCEGLQQLTKKYTGHRAFITIDQEGGMVTRLSEDSVNIPGAMAIAATRDEKNAYMAGRITGQQLRTLGFNFDLAPVADINSNMDNPVIGVRSYGDEPDQVAKYCVAMMKGLTDGGVLASAKHFPGHGDTNVDSHLGLPKVHKSLEEMELCELVSFKALIEAGIPAIMSSHIIFPALEEELPATMSRKIITGLLKEKLGFKGLVISDCMEMSAIKKYYGSIEGIKHAIEAGVDLIFVSHTMSVAREASDVLTGLYEKGELSMDEMDASIDKIMYYKDKCLCNENEKHDTNEFDVKAGIEFTKELLRKSLTPIQMPSDNLPVVDHNSLFLGCMPFRATNVFNIDAGAFQFADYMAKYFNGNGILTSPQPTDEEMEALIQPMKEASTVVIATYNAHLYKEQLKLVELAAKSNTNVIVFALRNPYDLKDLPANVYGIAVYEYTLKSVEALAEYMKQPYELSGKLPVKM